MAPIGRRCCVESGQIALAPPLRKAKARFPMELARPLDTISLAASRYGRFDPTRAFDALADLNWLGPIVEGEDALPGNRRVRTELELPIMDGSAPGPIRKAAYIDIGMPRMVNNEVHAEVGWRSASFAPLFPVLAGELRVSTSSITLSGAYIPPLGRVGLVIDRAVLHLVARRTARAFLTRIAARLDDG